MTLYQPTPAEIEAVTETMTATYAGDGGRIERAKQLITDGAVSYVSNGIGWQVDSQRNLRRQDPEDIEPKNYLVSSVSCSCADHMVRASAIGRCGDQTITVRPACKHILSVQMYMKIIAAKFNETISRPMSAAYMVEMRHNLYGVFDRLTNQPICGAVYVVRSDSYRPETGQDAADFAHWLAAHPEDAEQYPGGLLEKVLRNAPDKLTLRADVVYGSPRIYTLSGYRYDGGTWVNLEYEDRQQFNETAWVNLLAACGFVMPGRPVKQRGLSYHYLLERGTGEQEHYGLRAAAGEYVERERIRRMFENGQEA